MRSRAFLAALALVAAGCGVTARLDLPGSDRLACCDNAERLVFSDEFDGSQLGAGWGTCYPWGACNNAGNNELQWYQAAQCQVSGGRLHLVAEKITTNGYPWRSGMIQSHDSFSFVYGRVEFVAQVPAGAGFWPTLWLLPVSLAFPPEFDVEEAFGDDTSVYYPNFHSVYTGQHQATVGGVSPGFHAYGLDWQPGSLTWTLDGRTVATYRGGDVPSERMYLLATLAISGTYPPDGSTPPSASLDVESIKVWQRG